MCHDVLFLLLLQNPIFMQVNQHFPQKVRICLAKWKISYEAFNIITFDPLAPESQAKIREEVLFLNHLQFS